MCTILSAGILASQPPWGMAEPGRQSNTVTISNNKIAGTKECLKIVKFFWQDNNLQLRILNFCGACSKNERAPKGALELTNYRTKTTIATTNWT